MPASVPVVPSGTARGLLMVPLPKRMRSTTAAVLLLATAASVPAQTVRTPHGTCTGGIGAIADLGFSRLTCEACVLDAANDVRFVVEPIISHVERTGPATGRLRDGDVLVAVDDALAGQHTTCYICGGSLHM